MADDGQKRALKILEKIMPKLHTLLGKHDLMKFHSESSSLYVRIETAMQILIRLNAGPPTPLHASDIYIDNLVKYLTKIRYIPENIEQDTFIIKFKDRIDYVYELYQWLLVNEDKVKIRAYLTKYVDPVNIPEEFLHDPDIRKVYAGNSELIELFWSEYKKYMAAEKGVQESKELQGDLKAMFQEAANIEKRTKAQKEKLQNIANSDTLTIFAKAYYEANRQQGKISNEISATMLAVRNLDRLINQLDEEEKKYGVVRDGNFLEAIHKTLARNRTMHQNSLLPEKKQGMQMCHILEESIRQSSGNNQLVAKAATLKNDVQALLNEKMTVHSSTEDKLSPFRKQAAAVSNKKSALAEKVRNQRNSHDAIVKVLSAKEADLHEAVGGQVYHGDQLKSFIGQLRMKSNHYKGFRSNLQAFSTEAVTLNRTIDILRMIDPTVDDLLAQPMPEESETKNESADNVHSDSVQEAKQLSRSLTQSIETMMLSTSQAHTQLADIKKEIENLAVKHEEAKDRYEQATKFVAMDLEALKEELYVKQDRIEILEQQWKDTTQELDKLDQIFGRLVDDLLDDDAGSKKPSYYDQLLEKKIIIEKALEAINTQVIKNQEKKEEVQRRVKFYKDLDVLITRKLGSL